MRRIRTVATVLAAIVALAVSAVPAEARTNTRSKPVIFVHGLDWAGASGVDCAAWKPMIDTLRAWGWSGSMVTLSYYAFDKNCSNSIDHHHAHSGHYGGTAEHDVNIQSSHGFDTRIEHLAYHLAWFIYDHYSKSGVTIDAVGHSMGGLILRYALAQVQRQRSDFPSYLYVEDVVTMGTPHAGTPVADHCRWADQCGQMIPGSSFINWLSSYATNPQTSGGTEWTLMGSFADEAVPAYSATSMDASHKVRYYQSSWVFHGDYLKDTSNVRDADVEYFDRGATWRSWYDAPWGVRWTDLSLYSSVW